jgi:sugar (pentulose or hexulose) kinase
MSHAPSLILAIDLGSTAFKAAVFDDRLRQIGAGLFELEYLYGAGGRIELEVELVDKACCIAIGEAIRSAGVSAEKIEAIAITSQAQTYTLVDRLGQARRPFISWQDARAADGTAGIEDAAIEAAPELARFAEHCSFPIPLDGLLVSQLAYLQKSEPGFLTPDDRIAKLPGWVAMRLTSDLAIDQNLAAMSGLYSLELGDWWPAMLGFCQIRPEQLPRLVEIGSTCSKTDQGAADWGLPAGIPVVLAGNDQTAGAFGAELELASGTNEAALVTLGTANVVYAVNPKATGPMPNQIRGPYPGGLYYRMAADSCGGNVVNWARTVLAGCESVGSFFEAVKRAKPGCEGVRFDAELPRGAGSWTGLGLHQSADEMARAVIESLNGRITNMVDDLGLDPKSGSILIAGGGSQSDVWISMLEDRWETRLTRTEADPRRGAARMALESAGD